MVWFYTPDLERRSCETRLTADGKAFELVIRDLGKDHVERFAELPKLMAREPGAELEERGERLRAAARWAS
jgi:hypothetical protein